MRIPGSGQLQSKELNGNPPNKGKTKEQVNSEGGATDAVFWRWRERELHEALRDKSFGRGLGKLRELVPKPLWPVCL